MPESALERAFANLGSGFSAWVREHDRFVVIGLLLSILPLPPACFIGLLLSVANLVLLKTRALDARESGIVAWSFALALVNSVLVISGMCWISNHVNSTGTLADLPFLPNYLKALIEHILRYFEWISSARHQGMVA